MSRRQPDGHPLGHRHGDPRHNAGDWHPRRDGGLPADQQGGGPRRPLQDNADERGRS